MSNPRIHTAAICSILLFTACESNASPMLPDRSRSDIVQLSVDSVTIAAGQTIRLKLRDPEALDFQGKVLNGSTVEWNSTSPSVATVDSAGVVSATTIGRTSVVVYALGKSDTAIVNVVTPIVAVAMIDSEPLAVAVAVGATARLRAIAVDADEQLVANPGFSWSSSADSVATRPFQTPVL